MRSFLVFIVSMCFFTISLFSEDVTLNKINSTSGYYIITYKNYDINLEISINGYKIKDGSSNEDSSGQEDINFWIIPGKNILTYRISERKASKKKSDFPKDPKAEINLTIGQKGQFPEDGERALSIIWPNESELTATGEWKTISFDPPFLPPSKLWSIAEKITWSKELESSAILYLESLTKALNSKDVNKVIPFFVFRAKDTSETRYYPADPVSDKKAMASMLKAFGPTWNLNKKKIKATLLCEDKIVVLTDSNDQPILTGKKGAAIPIYLSLVEGKWMISR